MIAVAIVSSLCDLCAHVISSVSRSLMVLTDDIRLPFKLEKKRNKLIEPRSIGR